MGPLSLCLTQEKDKYFLMIWPHSAVGFRMVENKDRIDNQLVYCFLQTIQICTQNRPNNESTIHADSTSL